MEQQPDTQEFVDPNSLEEHHLHFQNESTLYLRIMTRGRLAGFFVLALDEDEHSVEFRRIVIDQEERGIGQQAIQLMESFCLRELSRTRLWLDVYEANIRGKHIYEKLEYRLFDKSSTQKGALLFYEKILHETHPEQ